MTSDNPRVVGATSVVLDDADLLQRARDGDDEGYAELFARYKPVGLRLARRLAPATEADDIVAEAFAQVLSQLRRGNGPDRAFRAYLLTSVRHEAGRRAKAAQRVQPTDDLQRIDRAVPFGDGRLDSFERDLIRDAFASLPERWQQVLWYLDVEGLKPHEISERLGLRPNSVSALVYRARAGLREAYVAQHVATTDDRLPQECRTLRPRLAGLVRRTAGMREQKRLHAHLETCADCMASYLELEDVNATMTAASPTLSSSSSAVSDSPASGCATSAMTC